MAKVPESGKGNSSMMDYGYNPPHVSYWPCKLAALVAVALGILLIMMGWGHIMAVVELAMSENRPFDSHFINMIAIGGSLIIPGLMGVVFCIMLWRGVTWAYWLCVLSLTGLLGFLIYLELAVAPNSSKVGSELDVAVVVVAIFITVLVSALALRRHKQRQIMQFN